MTKILIVDDEPIVRLGIKALGEWENEGFLMDYEASNGKTALSVLKDHPDIGIVITDIDMPIMDGIELTEKMQMQYPDILVLVLSAYSDYNLVRQTFKNGIFDYIIKSDMTYAKILSQLKNAKKELNKRTQKMQELDELRSQEEKVKKYYLKETMLTGNLLYSLPAGYYFLVYFVIHETPEPHSDLQPDAQLSSKILNVVKNTVLPFHCVECVNLAADQYAILFSLPQKIGHAELHEYALNVVKKLRASMKNYLNIAFTASYSPLFTTQAQIAENFQKALSAANLRFFWGTDKLYSESELILAQRLSSTRLPDLSALSSNVDAGNYDGAESEIQEMLVNPEKAAGLKVEEIVHYYRDMLSILYGNANQREEMEDICGTLDDFYQVMNHVDTLCELNQKVLCQSQKLLYHLKQKAACELNDFIWKAKNYIRKNYSDPKMSVELVSSYVCVSPSHFSTTFVRQTGEKFHEYLAAVRISKAKELIKSTQLRDYEIAEEIGISNSETFSRLFKKMVGCTPREYRKKYL